MKHNIRKFAATALSALLVFSLTACGIEITGTEVIEEPEETEAAAAVEETPLAVCIEADGQQILVMDASGMTTDELLDKAGITLNEGDYVTVDTEDVLDKSITIRVVRRISVSIVAPDEEGNEQHYILSFYGSTVEEAFATLGIQLQDGQTLDTADELLYDGMTITVSGSGQIEEEEEETVTAATNTNTNTNRNTGNAGSTGDTGSTGGNTDTGTGKEIASVAYYDDCDGSGHGLKVITYTDGTQDEIEY